MPDHAEDICGRMDDFETSAGATAAQDMDGKSARENLPSHAPAVALIDQLARELESQGLHGTLHLFGMLMYDAEHLFPEGEGRVLPNRIGDGSFSVWRADRPGLDVSVLS